MNRHRLRKALAAGTALLALAAAIPAQAQWVVFDPQNYVQNVMTAARELQQINNQTQQIENQTQSLINQAKNLASLPYSLVSTITSQIQRTEQLLAQAQRIAYSVASINQAFTTSYGAINLNLSAAADDRPGAAALAELRRGLARRLENAGDRGGQHHHQPHHRDEPWCLQPVGNRRPAGHADQQPAPGPDLSAALGLIALESANGRAQGLVAAAKATDEIKAPRNLRTSSTTAPAISPAPRRCSTDARPAPQHPRYRTCARLRPGRGRDRRGGRAFRARRP